MNEITVTGLDIDRDRFFSSVSCDEIKERIHAFQRIDFSRLDVPSIRDRIGRVLTFRKGDVDQSIWDVCNVIVNPGYRFYRVRRLSGNLGLFPIEDMKSVEDLWEIPNSKIDKCRASRINYDREPMIYTAFDNPKTAFEELRIRKDELFALIAYDNVLPLMISAIGVPIGLEITDQISRDTYEKIRLINGFFTSEFTRIVDDSNRFMYKISEVIAHDYICNPNHDGWLYPSVARDGDYNICFDVRAKQKLIVSSVFVCSSINEDYELASDMISLKQEDGGLLSPHPNCPNLRRLVSSHILSSSGPSEVRKLFLTPSRSA